MFADGSSIGSFHNGHFKRLVVLETRIVLNRNIDGLCDFSMLEYCNSIGNCL